MLQIRSWTLNPRWAPAVYFVVGQAAWFACVLGAARGIAYLGVTFVVALLAVHLIVVARPLAEIKLIASVMLMGTGWDSTLIHLGLLAYPYGMVVPGMAPLWIVALWALFAAQFNTTYRWLRSRLWAGSLLGAFAGPLSFRAGAALGAVRFVEPVPAAVALALGWAIILPAIILLSRRWDGVEA